VGLAAVWADLGASDMSNKEMVIDAVRELPDEATLEDILEQIKILSALQRSAEAADAGQVIPHEDVKKKVASWNLK
jgi:predicted transcriptional regulator